MVIRFLKTWWKRRLKALDKALLGPSIEKGARNCDSDTVQEFKDFAWAMHKVIDPLYGPEDLTAGEAQVLQRLASAVTTEHSTDVLENGEKDASSECNKGER